MADNTNIPKPEQIEALTRAEQVLKDQIESTTKIRFKSNEEFRKTVEINQEYLKKLNGIEIALDGQLDLYNEINKKVQDFGKGLTDNLKNAKLQSNTQLSLKGIYSSLNNLQGKLITNQEDLLRGELSSNDVAKDLLKNRLLQQNIVKASIDTRNREKELSEKIKKYEDIKEKQGGKLYSSQEKFVEKLNEQYKATVNINKDLGTAEEAQASITNELQNQLDNILEIETHTGVAGKLLKGFSKIPILGDMLDIQGAQKAMNIAAANGTKGFSLLGTGISALGPSLKAALGPLGLILMAVDAFKALIGAMFDADKQVTSLAKNLSISKDEAAGVREYFIGISNSIDTTYNRLQDVIDAQIQLSELSKFTILYSKSAIENQIALTKEIGLSEDEAAKLNKSFILNNVEGTEGTDIVYDRIAAFANENKIIANGRKILQEVSKVSGQILLNFRGNLPALTEAVLQADKLGINLEDARSISNSLLDFESSISNELEAGIFLGRRFNLEKARSLALQKDYIGATEEVLKQVGSIEEFESMSAIHQQVIAKAAGMTVDKLADSLMYQKFIGTETGRTIDRFKAAGREDLANRLMTGKLQGEELKAAQSSLTAQEKFNLALDKAKEIFTNLVDGGTLDMLAGILKDIANYVASITGIKGGINVSTAQSISESAKKELKKTEQPQSLEEKKLTKSTLESQKQNLEDIAKDKTSILEALNWDIPKAFNLLFGSIETKTKVLKDIGQLNEAAKNAEDNLQLINPAIEKLSKEIELTSPTQPVKDGYSDSSDGPFEITNRYGETAITAVGDKLAVGPNINTRPSSPSLDLTPFINAFNEFKNDVIISMNRPQPTPQFALHVDGRQIGTAIGKQMETGTAQNIYTGYKVA